MASCEVYLSALYSHNSLINQHRNIGLLRPRLSPSQPRRPNPRSHQRPGQIIRRTISGNSSPFFYLTASPNNTIAIDSHPVARLFGLSSSIFHSAVYQIKRLCHVFKLLVIGCWVVVPKIGHNRYQNGSPSSLEDFTAGSCRSRFHRLNLSLRVSLQGSWHRRQRNWRVCVRYTMRSCLLRKQWSFAIAVFIHLPPHL
jgi:hypothetical protein